jgi:hypothetical protein
MLISIRTSKSYKNQLADRRLNKTSLFLIICTVPCRDRLYCAMSRSSVLCHVAIVCTVPCRDHLYCAMSRSSVLCHVAIICTVPCRDRLYGALSRSSVRCLVCSLHKNNRVIGPWDQYCVKLMKWPEQLPFYFKFPSAMNSRITANYI